MRTAEKIIGVSLASITDIYTTRCIRKATSIVTDPTHPSRELFSLLPSGRRYSSIQTLTGRMLQQFLSTSHQIPQLPRTELTDTDIDTDTIMRPSHSPLLWFQFTVLTARITVSTKYLFHCCSGYYLSDCYVHICYLIINCHYRNSHY